MTDRNPGPELDAQVAPLMGWKRLPGDSDHPDGYWQSPDGETTPVDQLSLPPWSTNIAAAWAVVEKMATLGYVCELHNDPVELTNEPWGWAAGFTSVGNTPSHLLSSADTAPHAICLAALQAMGAEQ